MVWDSQSNVNRAIIAGLNLDAPPHISPCSCMSRRHTQLQVHR